MIRYFTGFIAFALLQQPQVGIPHVGLGEGPFIINDKMEELRRESLLTDLRQRIRDVRQGPDGLLYLLTEEEDGALLRIEPAP